MASLETLPSDQRAVLQMVLGSGRGYDEIAKLLSIERSVVRDRALAALDALGPETGVPEPRRHLITDYLLGQLPPRIAEDTRDSLAKSPAERAWARVVASELTPLSSGRLAEIPSGAAEPDSAAPLEAETAATAQPEPDAAAEAERARASEAAAVAAEAKPAAAEPGGAEAPAGAQAEPAAASAGDERGGGPPRRVSRLGGGILLGIGAAVVVAVVLVLVLTGGSSKKSNPQATHTTGTSKAATTTATPVAQINLLSPNGSKRTAGIAEVLRQGSNTAIAIVGQGLPANTKHNAYAVWLYNSASDAMRLGFVNPGVSKNGRLETTGPLPTNASHFKQVLVTLETQANPKAPGQVVLQGNLAGV